jgi:hypothetical protein
MNMRQKIYYRLRVDPRVTHHHRWYVKNKISINEINYKNIKFRSRVKNITPYNMIYGHVE